MSSYDEFAAVYETLSAEMTEDVPFYTELVREADGPVVELAVGSGRVAIPAARATAKRIVGIDRSPAMLAKGREAAAGVQVEFREGDMRDFALDQPASLVYCPYRALFHLPTWRDKRRVFERVAASLRPGGRFAFNAFVFDYTVAARNAGEHLDAAVPHVIAHSPADNRVDIGLIESGAQISLWWCTRSEWEGLIDVAGLEVEALYGWFDRRPFDEDSREFVYVCRKP